MLQPKAYSKEKQKVYDVKYIDFDNETLELLTEQQFDFYAHVYDFDEIEFVENTGFEDKNGKDIFVGDIIKQHKSCLRDRRKNFLVEKHDFDKRYTFFNLEEYYYDLDEDEAEFVEVIGNIYEHKEFVE